MYLARKRIQGRDYYYIRESINKSGGFVSRDLFYLGSNPEQYIIYPGGNAFYINEEVEENLAKRGFYPTTQELEDIFWPFVDPVIRHSLRGFRKREETKRIPRRITAEEEDYIRQQIHIVDKRRVNYLRMGQLDQTKLHRIPEKLYRDLLYKSRDEIEQYFLRQELSLSVSEYSSYVFSFLNLRRFFYEIFAGKMPQGLNQEKMDRLFIQEICSLNLDPVFWGQEQHNFSKLHPYLVRYVIMYFDYPFAPSTYLDDILNEFIFRHRFHRRPAKEKRRVSFKEACAVFEVSQEKLRKMPRRELIHLYRKMAQKHHPDKGGDHETFIQLTKIYKQLLRTKKPSR